MRKSVIALTALSVLAVSGAPFAQTPDGTTPNRDPYTGSGTPQTNPHGQTANVNASAQEAAVAEQIRGAGFTGPSNLHREMDGTWHGRAFKDNTEVAVIVDAGGQVSYRY
jgi:hypothetical protein